MTMSQSEKGRILVIDDDEGIRKVISEALKGEGYMVDTAGNAKEAIEKSQNLIYDLALVDIRLPDMEGTQLLTNLREAPTGMIKILITGYPALQSAIEALNKGAHGYLVKPVKMDELIKTIDEHLKQQRLLSQKFQKAATSGRRTQTQLLRCPQCRQISFWIWYDEALKPQYDVSCLNCQKTFNVTELL